MIMVIICGFIFNLFCVIILMDINFVLFYYNLRFFLFKDGLKFLVVKGILCF